MEHRQLPKCFRWEAMGVLSHGTMIPGIVPGRHLPSERRNFTLPSTYAHFCLGRETARLLTPEPLEAITRYPQLYSIGLHGPDLFFYYKPLSKNPVSRLGHEFHDRPGRDF